MKKYCFLLLFVLLFTAVAAQADSLSSLSGNKEAKVAECYAEMEFKEEDGPWWVVISDKEGNRLNLREKPNKSAKSLAKYFAGTIVRQLEPAKGGWMLVEIGPMTGYVDVDYLQEGTAYKENEIKLVTVHNENGTGANLRSAPNTDRSKVIRTLSNGKTAYAIGVLPEGWLQLLYKNEYYFAKASLFTPLLQMSLDEIHIGKKGVYYVYNPNPADRLNLRKNATAEAASFAKFYGGTALEVIDFDQTHEWARVRVMQLDGWMNTQFLKAKRTQIAMPEAVVAEGGAILCPAPEDYSSMATLNPGTSLTVYGFNDSGWVAVEVNGVSGYMGWVKLIDLASTESFSWSR